jgi:membrane protein required for colicin V production
LASFDLLILVILAFSAIKGFMKGFVRALLSILAAVFTLLFGASLVLWITPHIQPTIGESYWLPLISYLVVFTGIYLAFAFLGRLIESGLKVVHLGFVNRIAGALIGVLRAALLFSFVFWLCDYFGMLNESYKMSSKLYTYIAPLAPLFVSSVKALFPGIASHLQSHNG